MGENTMISWAKGRPGAKGSSWNLWWGCTKVSPACDNCYAEAWAKRHGLGWGDFDAEGKPVARRFFGDAHWDAPHKWQRAAKKAGIRHGVFVNSMSDFAEARADLEPHRARFWSVVEQCPDLDFLILTKRPWNLAGLLPWMNVNIYTHADHDKARKLAQPWPNVWIGTTVENQEWAARRLWSLLDIPAVVHFASYEPALGPIDFMHLVVSEPGDDVTVVDALHGQSGNPRTRYPLDWIVAGDESGADRRAAEVDWFRSAQRQCELTGRAFHFKQWAGDPNTPGIGGVRTGNRVNGKIHLPMLDGRQHEGYPA